MSLVKLSEDLFERFTLVTHPRRTFISSSSGVTGSVKLYVRESPLIKDVSVLGSSLTKKFEEDSVEAAYTSLKNSMTSALLSGSGESVADEAQNFLNFVNDRSTTALNDKMLTITRFMPTVGNVELNVLKKSVVIDRLMPYYRSRYPESHYAYTNYNCLNFFTASSVPSDSVLIYPAVSFNTGDSDYNMYNPVGPFTIDFYINPRYTTLNEEDEFRAGTIIHMSSSYVVSLVTGSQVDAVGRPAGYRILLQLSHSADIMPSLVDLSIANNQRNFPEDLIFLSQDNSLQRNHWHHVSIRWGGFTQNNGSGSFVIDGVERGSFNVPSASIRTTMRNDALFVGNFYVGSNSGSNMIRYFFNENAASVEGVRQLVTGHDPLTASFTHPLNAEIHDLKVFDVYRSIEEIVTSSMQGPNDLTNLIFYLPPFFTRESRSRTYPVTPFHTRSGQTYDPFNVEYSFGVNGHLINLENFTREIVRGNYPRLFNLTASIVDGTLDPDLTANDYLYATGSIRKRNLTILPCDNGLFVPNFDLLVSASMTISSSVTASDMIVVPAQGEKVSSGSSAEKYVSDLGIYNPRLITLRRLVPSASVEVAKSSLGEFEDANEHIAPSPKHLDEVPSAYWSLYSRTQDDTSNQVVFFDISNMLYGRRILPGTFQVIDWGLTGSDGRVRITLRDDGSGNLYRADAKTKHATWSSVGNIFYNEGVSLVKSPNLPLFCQDHISMSFQGERQIYVMRINVPCPAGEINSSSNPSYMPISASLNANETDSQFVYITGLAFHDNDLNVVMRTNLSQPIIKKLGDKVLFRPKIDF